MRRRVKKYKEVFSVAVQSPSGRVAKMARDGLVFANSMSDLFHKSMPTALMEAVFKITNPASQDTFQMLTYPPGKLLNRVVQSKGWDQLI